MTLTIHTKGMPHLLRRWRVGLGRMAWWKFAVILFFTTLALKLLAVVLVGVTAGVGEEDFPDRSGLGWVLIVVIAPLLETLVSQSLVIWLARKILRGSFLWPVVISGILFGCMHLISPVYAVAMAFVGAGWGFAYLARLERRGFGQAYWSIVLVHAATNSLAFIIS